MSKEVKYECEYKKIEHTDLNIVFRQINIKSAFTLIKSFDFDAITSILV